MRMLFAGDTISQGYWCVRKIMDSHRHYDGVERSQDIDSEERTVVCYTNTNTMRYELFKSAYAQSCPVQGSHRCM